MRHVLGDTSCNSAMSCPGGVPRLRLLGRQWLAIMLLATGAACGEPPSGNNGPPPSQPPPPPPPPPISLRQTIGPGGGTVASSDGRVSLTIPAGALAADVQISIDEMPSPPEHAIPGAAFEIGPTGTQFATAAILTIRYDPARLRTGAIEDSFSVAKFRPDGTMEFHASEANSGADRVTGRLLSLSPHGLVWCCPPPTAPNVVAVYMPNRTIEVTVQDPLSYLASVGVVVERAITSGSFASPQNSDYQFFTQPPTGARVVVDHTIGRSAGFYWYRARYLAGNGNTWPATNPGVRVTVFALPNAPAQVVNLTLVADSTGSVDVNFTPGAVDATHDGAEGFKISRRLVSSGVFVQIADRQLGDALPYRDTGVSPNTDYEYEVVAYNLGGVSPGARRQVKTLPGPPLPPAPALTARPSAVSLTPGALTAVWLGNPGNAPVTLRAAVQPATGMFAVRFIPVTLSGSVGTVQFDALPTAIPGLYTVTITATTAGGATRSVQIPVTVNPLTDFAVSMQSPVFWNFDDSRLQTVTLDRAAGFAATVSLTMPDLHTGIAQQFLPATLSGATSTSQLAIHVNRSSTPGGLQLPTLTGTVGSIVRTQSVVAIVGGIQTSPAELVLVPAGHATIVKTAPSPSVTVPIVIGRPGPTTGPAMSLGIAGLPAGVTASFGTNPITGHSTLVTFTASSAAPTGTFQLTVSATNGSQTVTAPMTLAVVAP